VLLLHLIATESTEGSNLPASLIFVTIIAIMVSLYNILLTVAVFASATVMAAPTQPYSLGPRIPSAVKSFQDLKDRSMKELEARYRNDFE
jgi:hypothetical protein